MRVELVAVHEAGHAVAHARLEIDQDAVSTKADIDSNTLGRSISAGVSHCWDSQQARDMAIAYCAGYASVRAAGFDEAEAIEGCDDDFANVEELVSLWGLETLDNLKSAALSLMSQPINLNAVARVAQELADRQTLDADLVEAVIELADGNCTEAEFEQFLRFRAQQKTSTPERIVPTMAAGDSRAVTTNAPDQGHGEAFDLAKWRKRLEALIVAAAAEHADLDRILRVDRPTEDADLALSEALTRERLRERAVQAREKVKRLRGLFNQRKLDRVWRRLAKGEKSWLSQPPGKAIYDALERVCDEICTPYSVIRPPTKERVAPYARAARSLLDAYNDDPTLPDVLPELAELRQHLTKAEAVLRAFDLRKWRGPLAPATTAGRNSEVNWAALHLGQTLAVYFDGPQHATIAALLGAALDSELTADNIRLLRSANQ